MTIKIYFDENKLMEDCKAWIIHHISDISGPTFIDDITQVAVDSIKSTVKVSTAKGPDLNIFKDT